MEKLVLIMALLGSFWMVVQAVWKATQAARQGLIAWRSWWVRRAFADTRQPSEIASPAPERCDQEDPWKSLERPAFMRKGLSFEQILSARQPEKPKRKPRRGKKESPPSVVPDFEVIE